MLVIRADLHFIAVEIISGNMFFIWLQYGINADALGGVLLDSILWMHSKSNN